MLRRFLAQAGRRRKRWLPRAGVRLLFEILAREPATNGLTRQNRQPHLRGKSASCSQISRGWGGGFRVGSTRDAPGSIQHEGNESRNFRLGRCARTGDIEDTNLVLAEEPQKQSLGVLRTPILPQVQDWFTELT